MSIRNIGKPQPSKQALERFTETYLKIVKENEKKEKEAQEKNENE